MAFNSFLWSTYLFVIIMIFPIIIDAKSFRKPLLCALSKKAVLAADDPEDYTEHEYLNNLLEENVVRCPNSYCYSVWYENGNNESIVMGQGCWISSGQNECEKSLCQSERRPNAERNNTKFCCCSKDMCNANFTDIYVPISPSESSTVPLSVNNNNPENIISYILLGVLFFITFILTICLSVYFCWKGKPKKCTIETSGHTMPTPPAEYNLEKLKLINIIGQGKYGSVWRGLIDEHEFAVKIFPSHYRNCFYNEYEMYKIVGENSCILKCYGGGEYSRALQNHPEFALLLNIEKQSLQEYLKSNTVDLATLSKMCLDIAKGLAHLHNDSDKSCVAHRDLNSKNILVKNDLSCCICDLGLAITPKSAESKALSEAGTIRYMAPEVLEGAVNLRDCESALKQTDVYALGLILWELGSRCVDMQNAEPLPYSPPFFEETGENPTLEQMQNLVSRHKIRPPWPISWKETAVARMLCETAEDCWDPDAEARLTALCVYERFLELPNMKGRALHPAFHPPPSPTPLINNNHLHDNSIDTTASTIETLLSPTTEEFSKNSNQLVATNNLPLQPYQGRNSCLERNLLLSASSDSFIIEKSTKNCTSSSHSETENLLTNQLLNYQKMNRANSIPYVQNHCYNVPKQLNILQPATAIVIVAPSSKEMNNNNNNRRKKFKWSNLKRFLHSNRNSEINRNAHKETTVKLKSKIVNGLNSNNPGVTTALLGVDPELKRPSSLGLSIAKPQELLFTNNSGVTQIIRKNTDNDLSKQRSLEHFSEVFSSITDLSRLKDPSQRVKTPGDVPPSVRKNRGKASTNSSSARFSLYDDRMMTTTTTNRGTWGSAPDLDPLVTNNLTNCSAQLLNNDENTSSISSF